MCGVSDAGGGDRREGCRARECAERVERTSGHGVRIAAMFGRGPVHRRAVYLSVVASMSRIILYKSIIEHRELVTPVDERHSPE